MATIALSPNRHFPKKRQSIWRQSPYRQSLIIPSLIVLATHLSKKKVPPTNQGTDRRWLVTDGRGRCWGCYRISKWQISSLQLGTLMARSWRLLNCNHTHIALLKYFPNVLIQNYAKYVFIMINMKYKVCIQHIYGWRLSLPLYSGNHLPGEGIGTHENTYFFWDFILNSGSHLPTTRI